MCHAFLPQEAKNTLCVCVCVCVCVCGGGGGVPPGGLPSLSCVVSYRKGCVMLFFLPQDIDTVMYISAYYMYILDINCVTQWHLACVYSLGL